VVGEEGLEALSAVALGVEDEVEALFDFGEAGVGLEEGRAAVSAFDSVEVGGEGEGAPAHFKVVLLEDGFGVEHRFHFTNASERGL
jgi:hypothetical protein